MPAFWLRRWVSVRSGLREIEEAAMDGQPGAGPVREAPTLQQLSETVSAAGWRYILGSLRASVAVRSLAESLEVASEVVAEVGAEADGHLLIDVRPDRLILTVYDLATARMTWRDTEIALRVSALVGNLGLATEPGLDGESRSVQVLEIGIDALDIPKIRSFWKAVLGYVDEAGRTGPKDPLVDPHGQQPAIWFQQMDAPRPQRNRIHFDISVPHDEAERRIKAAIEAGGHLVSDRRAPAFWVLADAEGNEACVTTWQGRDG